MVFPHSGVDRATPVFHLKQQIPEGREFLLGWSTLIQRRALVCPLQYIPEFTASDAAGDPGGPERSLAPWRHYLYELAGRFRNELSGSVLL